MLRGTGPVAHNDHTLTCVCIICETEEQTGLAHARVANQKQLKEVVTVWGGGGGGWKHDPQATIGPI